MEDTFKVRVDRIFGSLSGASPSPAADDSFRSLWSLTDDEVERKEWNRDKGSPEQEEFPPERPSNWLRLEKDPLQYRGELEKDLEDDDLEDEERELGSSSRSVKPDDHNDDEWEIRSSIGCDSTLDYEEEEDQYDKVAVGREKAGDRLYMNDINDYGIIMESADELPDSIRRVGRDPRANHMAAKIRLKEDAEAAGKLDSLSVSEASEQSGLDTQVQPSEYDLNLKPILKRKDGQADTKLQKRVRFDPNILEKATEAEDVQMEHSSSEELTVSTEVSVPSGDFSSAVPDYVRNPSKYTHYTFDSSSDIDDQSNRQACMDFLTTLKSANSAEKEPNEAPPELPKSITFVPRKKTNDPGISGNGAGMMAGKEELKKEGNHKKGFLAGIDVEDDQEDEACAMDEDEMESSLNSGKSSQKAGRKYRMRSRTDVDDD